jgi:VWFA-related protein
MTYRLDFSRPARRLLAPAWSVLLAVALASGLSAQSAAEAPQSLFIERVDISIVNVEVFVDGEEGQGLTAEDFQIFEDGKPVEISNFYASRRLDRVTADFAADRELVASGGRPAPDVQAAREVPDDQRLNLLVYIDNYNLRPENRQHVLKELGRFLEDRVYQHDRVMLVAYGRKVEVVQPFTQDMRRIMEGVERIAGMGTFRQNDDALRRRVEIEMFDNVDPVSGLEAIRLYAQGQRAAGEKSLRSFAGAIRSMGGLVGRKAVLYVGDGIERRPGEGLYQLLADASGPRTANRSGVHLDSFRQDIGDVIEDVTREANAHQVTLYTLHARGPAGASRLAADQNGGAASSTAGGSLNAHMTEVASSQETLMDLAQATGGTMIANTLNYDQAFQALSRDFDNLYSLGYRSRNGGDGKFHKIEVKVDKPGLKLRYRNGYVDKDSQARIADRTVSALLFEQQSNAIGARVEFGTPVAEKRDQYTVNTLLRVPFNGVTVLPEGNRLRGRLRIFVAVQDEVGLSEVQEIPFPVDVGAADLPKARGKEIGQAVKLLLRGGLSKVAFGIWDEVSGNESFIQQSVMIGDPPAKAEKGKKPRG